MTELDLMSVSALTGLMLLRLGIPILGIWLLSTVLKRTLPAQV